MYYFDDDIVKKYVLESIKNGTAKTEEYHETMINWVGKPGDVFDDEEQVLFNEAFRKLREGVLPDENMENYLILNTINYFSSNFLYRPKLVNYIVLKQNGLLQRYERTKYGFNLTLKDDSVIEVERLSRKVEGASKCIKGLTNFFKRQQECHLNSILLSQAFQSENSVVTGYIQSSKYKFIHSWVETKSQDNQEDLVFDSTMNAVMKKSDYYKLRQVEPVSSLSRQQLQELFKKQNLFGEGKPLEGVMIKEMLLWYEDIIEILRNQFGIKFSTFPENFERQM